MNLFRNSNFKERATNKKDKGKPGTVVFSGFLMVFLGTAGIQSGLADTLDLLQSENKKDVPKKIADTQPDCPTHLITLASLEIAKQYSKEQKEVELNNVCQAEKNIQNIIDDETDIPEENNQEIQAIIEIKEREKELYDKKVLELEKMLKGYPLAKMAPEIAKQETEIAALIVGIARKESQWGVHSPKKNGDCFNYWGYKGSGGRGVGMGYACFATPEEAVENIANRLEKIVSKRGTSKPSALVTTWKCGSSCAGHSKESVSKWVSDVNQYYTKVLAMK